MCGEQLARAGHEVVIFDEHWRGKAVRRRLNAQSDSEISFLLENSHPKN